MCTAAAQRHNIIADRSITRQKDPERERLSRTLSRRARAEKILEEFLAVNRQASSKLAVISRKAREYENPVEK